MSPHPTPHPPQCAHASPLIGPVEPSPSPPPPSAAHASPLVGPVEAQREDEGHGEGREAERGGEHAAAVQGRQGGVVECAALLRQAGRQAGQARGRGSGFRLCSTPEARTHAGGPGQGGGVQGAGFRLCSTPEACMQARPGERGAGFRRGHGAGRCCRRCSTPKHAGQARGEGFRVQGCRV